MKTKNPQTTKDLLEIKGIKELELKLLELLDLHFSYQQASNELLIECINMFFTEFKGKSINERLSSIIKEYEYQKGTNNIRHVKQSRD